MALTKDDIDAVAIDLLVDGTQGFVRVFLLAAPVLLLTGLGCYAGPPVPQATR